LQGTDAAKCAKVDKEDFKTASTYAVWGRKMLNQISVSVLVCSSLLFAITLVFGLALTYSRNERTKITWAKVYIFAGFFLIGVGIMAAIFYFCVVAKKLDLANQNL
jgi:4-amino-4-deoxy-L-arabinose transferase-like glycosyltransferase